MKHQDHFRCRITCGYCGKRRHDEEVCHIKHRNSKKPNKAEEERRKNAGVNQRAEVTILGDPPARGTLIEDKGSQHPPTGRREAPNPTPKGEQPGEKRTIPSTPRADGVEKNQNAKEQAQLALKCLQAAGVDLQFPEEG